MTNGSSTRGSKILVGAIALMIGASTTFAGMLIPIVAGGGGDNIQRVSAVKVGGGGLSLVDPDGTWIFNTNSTAAPWSTTANWSGGIIADGGGFANFSTIDITGARNPDIDTTSRTVRRIDIGDTNGTHSYTISASSGASLIFDNTANSANAQLNQTATSKGDTISAPITLNSSLDVTNASSNTLTLGGAISGVGAVNLASGTLALGSSANTYAGGTTINGGKITIGASGTPLGSGTLTLAGGTLTSTASRSTALSSVVVTADSAITTTSNAATVNLPFSGTLTGTAGTLTIRNDGSSTTGQFDVRFSGGDYTMSRPIVIDNGASTGTARLSDFNISGTTHTYSGVISGNGSYNRSVSSGSAGLTIFLAANTYTGTTTVNSGTLQLGNGGLTGSLSPSSAITINTAGTLRFDHTTGADFTQGTDFSSSAITGAGKIIKDGTCTLTLNVANTFAGGLTINKGTVIATADGALGTGNVSLTASGSVTLTLQGITNSLSDTGTLTVALDSTVNLNYTGTDVVAGLVVNGVAQGPGTYSSTDFSEFAGTGTITVVPEPTTVAMMALGAGLLVGVQRFRRKLR
jgi:fibronectin-binding autotransporter adhesin